MRTIITVEKIRGNCPIYKTGDKITIEQAIDFVEGIPTVGRNVDNCYIEPYDDAIDKLLDLLKRLKEKEDK